MILLIKNYILNSLYGIRRYQLLRNSNSLSYIILIDFIGVTENFSHHDKEIVPLFDTEQSSWIVQSEDSGHLNMGLCPLFDNEQSSYPTKSLLCN